MVEPKDSTSSAEAGQLPAVPGTEPAKAGGMEQGNQPVKGATKEATKEEGTKTFTAEDFKKYQASKDKEIAALQQKHKTELEGVQSKISELVGKERARAKSDFIKDAEAKGVDKEEAAQIFDKRISLETKESEIERREREVNAALMMLGASQLVKKHNLDDAAQEELLKAKDPDDMERIALRLEVDKLRAGSQPPVKTDPGPQTPAKGDSEGTPLAKWLRQNVKD